MHGVGADYRLTKVGRRARSRWSLDSEILYAITVSSMLLWIEYQINGEVRRVHNGTLGQQVPVLTRSGSFVLRPLGKGDDVADTSPGHFLSWPDGQTVSLDTLRHPTGLWQLWSGATVPVKIPAARFFYYNDLGYPNACDLKPGEYLQGAMIRKPLAERVYFVLVPPPPGTPATNPWWPRVIGTLASASGRKFAKGR